ncbi:MAG: class I SAM-dependent methyltransferase [Caulobacteraceae bacterium]|nr:class I SAM-dependent methyltransferase [Caulobacteraceae bacterium]
MNLEKYLNMQKNVYNEYANSWSLQNRDYVVGTYDDHNNWPDYDVFLFKGLETKNLNALEYGCGPGRNIVKFNDKFSRIDGVDISEICIEKAKENLNNSEIKNSNLYVCDGKSIPINDEIYDILFSVICLQHIACYSIRFNIFKEAFRVLKKNGYFCFQLGFGGKDSGNTADYYSDMTDVTETNGGFDVGFDNENFLIDDLINKIGFKNYKSDIRPTGPGDGHKNWIWVQVQK